MSNFVCAWAKRSSFVFLQLFRSFCVAEAARNAALGNSAQLQLFQT
jgi:hypothetical protein